MSHRLMMEGKHKLRSGLGFLTSAADYVTLAWMRGGCLHVHTDQDEDAADRRDWMFLDAHQSFSWHEI